MKSQPTVSESISIKTEPDEIITYSLLGEKSDSTEFYRKVEIATRIFFSDFGSLENLIDEFIKFSKREKVKIAKERIALKLELVFIGIYWREYSKNIERINFLNKPLFKLLLNLRKKSPRFKPFIDDIRGALSVSLVSSARIYNEKQTLKNFTKLIDWLEATGEFKEEIRLMKLWSNFFQTLDIEEFQAYFSDILLKGEEFYRRAKNEFGDYCQNLDNFFTNKLDEYKGKEDYIFVARKESEYYLNMLGAEALNIAFKKDYSKTSKKAVLLPACMRSRGRDECKAVKIDYDFLCSHCDKNCAISKIDFELKKYGIPVFIIPHSSDFTKALKKWENSAETGLIGVQCLLNLLTGGYEMSKLNIHAQCVYLDYCGCINHWSDKGIQTNLNLDRLLQKLEISSPS